MLLPFVYLAGTSDNAGDMAVIFYVTKYAFLLCSLFESFSEPTCFKFVRSTTKNRLKCGTNWTICLCMCLYVREYTCEKVTYTRSLSLSQHYHHILVWFSRLSLSLLLYL